jgi:hypothetical protein
MNTERIERITDYVWGNVIRNENVFGAYGRTLTDVGLARHVSGGLYVMSDKTAALADMYKGSVLLFQERARKAADYAQTEAAKFQLDYAFQMVDQANEELKNVIRAALVRE